MGCGCAGSTPQTGSGSRTAERGSQQQAAVAAALQDGGPGTPSYYSTWEPPKRAPDSVETPPAK